MNEDDKDEAHEEFVRQAAHKKETEADLAKLDDEHAKVNVKHSSHAQRLTGLEGIEARVQRLEEALRLSSPEAAAHLDKK